MKKYLLLALLAPGLASAGDIGTESRALFYVEKPFGTASTKQAET